MTQKTRIRVAIGAQLLPVGELIFETDGVRETSAFRYADEWLERPNRFALAPSMPLGQAPFFSSSSRENRRGALPGPIGDGTPDSWGRGIIRRALGRQPSEIDVLLTTDDRTRQGALRYLDEDGKPLSQTSPPIPRATDLADLAHLARVYEADPALGQAALKRLIEDAGSLGGARPKATFDDDGVPSIAKFTSERDILPVERMEVATLRLARAAGLNAASARLEMAGTAYPAAIVARFDRRDGGRVHYLSAASFMGFDAVRGGFFTDLADQMRAHCASPMAEMEELHRRVMFSVLISNRDNHLRNEGVVYAGEGKHVLAPAFDINPEPDAGPQMQTGISELSGFEASIEATIEAAPFFDVTRDRARATLRTLVETIDGQWEGFCREAGMSQSAITAYRPAFESREIAVARAMLAPRVAVAPSPSAGP